MNNYSACWKNVVRSTRCLDIYNHNTLSNGMQTGSITGKDLRNSSSLMIHAANKAKSWSCIAIARYE